MALFFNKFYPKKLKETAYFGLIFVFPLITTVVFDPGTVTILLTGKRFFGY